MKHLNKQVYIILLGIVFLLSATNLYSQKKQKAVLTGSFIASSYTITAGECVNFFDESTGGPTFWRWSFPGAQITTSFDQNPTGICYHTVGTYDVMLEVQNGNYIDTEVVVACITVTENTLTPIADFVADFTTIPIGEPVTFTNISQNGPFTNYSWKFEGGTPDISTAENPMPVAYNQAGTYKVELTVTDENGIFDKETKHAYITVIPASNINPEADFLADKLFIAPGQFINFSNQSSGSTYIWEWTFEGAETPNSDVKNPWGIQYLNPGTYDVSLRVENNMGSDVIVKNDYIVVSATQPPCNEAPIADFYTSQRLVKIGTKIFFENRSENNPTSWNWFFQGGFPTYSVASNTIDGIEFNSTGFFDISLSVNNACGSDYAYKEDYIMIFSGNISKYCDTITNIGETEVLSNPALGGSWGTIGGHNGQRTKIYADKYEEHTFTQLEAIIVPVTVSERASDNSYVTFYVWDGSTEYPETILAEKRVSIRNLPENFYSTVEFDEPVTLEGPFFVGYEINYIDNNSDGISDDQFAVSIANDRGMASTNSTLYVQSNSEWTNVTEKFGIKTSSAIKPVTCLVDVDDSNIENEIAIYPNPASNYVNINLGEIEIGKDCRIELYDITGRMVLAKDIKTDSNEIVLNTSEMPNGLYFVNLHIEDYRHTNKILISR